MVSPGPFGSVGVRPRALLNRPVAERITCSSGVGGAMTRIPMHRSTLTKLGLLVFGLIFVSFLVRGFGQFVLGPRRATMLAGPLALLAAVLLVVVVVIWVLGRLGVVSIESPDGDTRD